MQFRRRLLNEVGLPGVITEAPQRKKFSLTYATFMFGWAEDVQYKRPPLSGFCSSQNMVT